MPRTDSAVTLRPETPADEPFLRRMILETVAAELGASLWPEPMRSQLLGIQVEGRIRSRKLGQIIVAGGEDCGWVVLDEAPDAVHLVDIMVDPARRSQGIGTAAIQQILAAGKPVKLEVNVTNFGAIQLYERLGFRRTGGTEVQYYMESGAAR